MDNTHNCQCGGVNVQVKLFCGVLVMGMINDCLSDMSNLKSSQPVH